MPAEILWTGPAARELAALPDHPRFKGDKKAWHERKVRRDAAKNMPYATRARIRYITDTIATALLTRSSRKPTHIGGVNSTEREHITVTYKLGNKDLGARHVYTDVESDSDSDLESE